jgi:antitoxin component YwqK of YwqJK toxin-antitoxin module
MKPFISILLLFFVKNIAAQKIEKFYDYKWSETDASKARFYGIAEKTDSGWRRHDYFIHEQSLQMAGLYEDDSCTIKNGYFYFFHPNGNLMETGKFVHDQKEGIWLSYYPDGIMSDSIFYEHGHKIGVCLSWHRNGFPSDSSVWNSDGSGVEVSWFDNGSPSSAGRYIDWKVPNGKWQFFRKNGKLSAIETYDHGKIIKAEYYDENGQLTDFHEPDSDADFPGGMAGWHKYIDKHIYFPNQYKFTNGDEAIVVISGVVDEDGNMTDVQVLVPFHKDFDKIILDAVKKSPKWLPAVQHNRNVKYRIKQEVTFKQND